MELSEEKKKMVEFLGMHWEQRMQIAPLAARIQALMILNPDEGLSFDEIVEFTKASKSSVSSNLNLLLKLKSVEYYTIPGDRKRYFKASKEHIYLRLKNRLENIKEEVEIFDKINDFKTKYCKKACINEHSMGVLYREFLKQQEKSIKEMLSLMEQNLQKN